MTTTWQRKKDDPEWRARKRAAMVAHYAKVRTSQEPYRPTGRPGAPPGQRMGTARREAEREAARVERSVVRQRARWLFLALQVPGCPEPARCKSCSGFFLPELVKDQRCRECRKVKRLGYRLRHPDEARACRRRARHRRRARERNAPGTFTQADWLQVLVRHDGRCARCCADGEQTIDHIVPLSLGGTNDPSNLQPMCHLCNSTKGATLTGVTR